MRKVTKINPTNVSFETVSTMIGNIVIEANRDEIESLKKGAGSSAIVDNVDAYIYPEEKILPYAEVASCRNSSGRRIERLNLTAPILLSIANSSHLSDVVKYNAMARFDEYVSDNPTCFMGLVTPAEAIDFFVNCVDGPDPVFIIESLSPFFGAEEVAKSLIEAISIGHYDVIDGRTQESFVYTLANESMFVHAEEGCDEDDEDMFDFAGFFDE